MPLRVQEATWLLIDWLEVVGDLGFGGKPNLIRRRARAVHGQFRDDARCVQSCCTVHQRLRSYVDRVSKSLAVAALLEDGRRKIMRTVDQFPRTLLVG